MLKTELKPVSVRQWMLTGYLALMLAAPGWAAAQGSGGIVVFGTSLSDPGNAFALLGATNTPPDYSVDPFLVPDRPYARGGQHFSNGATWVEQLARPLGLAGSVRPAFASNAGATNFAVGGARARAFGDAPDLSRQVGAFLSGSGGSAPSEALYVVEMGGNDLRDALVAATDDARFLIIGDAIGSIARNIAALYGAGARKFLVWSAPDLGLTPAILGLDQLRPGTAAGASFLSQTFNFHLDLALADLAHFPGISIRRLDAFGKLHDIVNRPQDFGLSNVNTACITPSVAPFACTDPDEFLFWDGIHPTGAGHAIIAHEAATALAR